MSSTVSSKISLSLELKRLKYIASINDEALPESTPSDYELQYIDIGNVDSSGTIHDVVAYVLENAPSRARRIVRHGDVIVSTVRTYLQAIAAIENPPENLIVSTGFAVVRPSSILHPKFCKYALKEPSFIHEVISRSVGVSYPAINSYELGDIRVSIPPFAVQEQIADFLDYETTRLDSLISAKENYLTIIAEKRRALITSSVTRGINPKVKLKNSGISWFGEIPEHWTTMRLKYIAEVRGGLTLGKAYGSAKLTEYSYLRVANVQDGHLNLTNIKTVWVPEMEAESCLLQAGDVLMNEGGDDDKLGRGCVWPGTISPCLHQNHVFAVRPKKVLPEWLDAWTSTQTAKSYFQSRAKRATNLASISASNIKELPVPLPPEDEQLTILEHIKAGTAKLDALKTATELTITLLRERRTALIAAAVTGKIVLLKK